MSPEVVFEFAQNIAPYVAATLAIWNDRKRKADAARIKELEAHEAKLIRLELRETEREATVNKLRTETWESRLGPDGKVDHAKDTDAKRAKQELLDMLRTTLWPRGDEKRKDA